jgi:hypothetical protein
MIRRPVDLIVALERECLDVDQAIGQRRWDACEISWKSQRLLTHELDIALREAALEPAEAEILHKRLDRVTRYRKGQLKRLRAFNEACSTELATLARFRSFSKNIDRERRSTMLDVKL